MNKGNGNDQRILKILRFVFEKQTNEKKENGNRTLNVWV